MENIKVPAENSKEAELFDRETDEMINGEKQPEPIEKEPIIKEEKKEVNPEPEKVEDKIEETENIIEEVKRPVYTMPVSKAQKEKSKAVEKAMAKAQAEYQQKLDSVKQEYEQRLANKPDNNVDLDVDSELEKFAKEKELDIESAKGLLEIFKRSIPQPDLSKYDKLLQEKEVEAHKMQVAKDFETDVIPMIMADYPSASQSHINNVKQEIEQLAFSSRFNTYSLADIYAVNKSKFEYKDKHTAEDPTGRTDVGISLESLSEDEASKLPAEQYSEWMDLQANKFSRYVDANS